MQPTVPSSTNYLKSFWQYFQSGNVVSVNEGDVDLTPAHAYINTTWY